MGEGNTERHWLLGEEYRFGSLLGLAGAVLVVAGFVAMVVAERVAPAAPYWVLREAAGVSGALGAPVALLGVTLTLAPRRPSVVGGAGVLITTLATGMFVTAYPSRWNVHRSADLTAEVGAFYLAGLGVLALGLAMAVRRARFRMHDRAADTGSRFAPEESGFVWSDDGD
jgi:hypothetical protein